MVLMRKLCLTAVVKLLIGDCLEIRVESTACLIEDYETFLSYDGWWHIAIIFNNGRNHENWTYRLKLMPSSTTGSTSYKRHRKKRRQRKPEDRVVDGDVPPVRVEYEKYSGRHRGTRIVEELATGRYRERDEDSTLQNAGRREINEKYTRY